MRLHLSIGLLLATVLSIRPEAQAPNPVIAQVADSAALVIAGRVSAIGVFGDAGGIYTYATIEVSEVLKGQLESSTIVVKQLGGTLRDIGLLVSDQAEFEVNEEVLLFLAVRPRDETLYTAGLNRGKWRIVTDMSTGGRVAVRDDASVAMDATLTQMVRNSRPSAQRFVSIPRELMISRPAFVFLPPSEGGPARWHQADDGERIPIDFQTVPGGLPGGGLPQLDGAIGAWNGVGTRLVLERQASGNPTCPAETFTGSGRVAFYWNDPCGEIDDGDSSTFGVGGGFFTTGFQKTINGVTFNKFLQGLAILNNTGPHLTSPPCLQDAATHVLGHAVGLGHSDDSGALMRSTLRGDCSGLAGDDIAGLRAIYPAVASGGVPPNAPTAITNAVSLDTVTLAWTAANSGGPAQSYVLEAGSGPGRADITTMLLNSPATSTVVGAVPPGQYHVRVRARNALGTSGPSPDTIVNVGPCAAPGAPGPISFTTADSLVTLNWTPPATGIAQGYWLYAGYGPGQSNALVMPLGPTPSFSAFAAFGHYYVRIAARNSCGLSAPTADVLVSVLPCTAAPAVPTALAFSRNGNIVTLGWTAPSSGNLPSRYRILAGSVSGAADILVHTTGNNATSFAAFAPAGRYYVRVQSQNNCGFSAESNEIQVVVP